MYALHRLWFAEAWCLCHQRVMPTSFFILQRFFMRVDQVMVRVSDTRIYYEVRLLNGGFTAQVEKSLVSKQGICKQTCMHCCQNREFVNKPHTHLHVCACSLIDMHMHMKTRTHTHTHTCTLLCCCDHHVLRRDYMWNICLDLGRTAPSLPCIYSLLFMPLPARLFVCVCMHGYICV